MPFPTVTQITTDGGRMFEAVDEDGEFLRIEVDRGVASVGDYAMQSDSNPSGVMAACNLDLHGMRMLRVWLEEAINEAELLEKEAAEA